MKLLLYISGADEVEDRLRRVLQGAVPKRDWEICRTIDGLSHTLLQYSSEIAVAVLAASTPGDLLDFILIGDLLNDLRVVLIVPDRNKEIISMVHKLRPRFFTYADGSFEDLGAVLKKMLEKDGS
jgi:hypothetical protein